MSYLQSNKQTGTAGAGRSTILELATHNPVHILFTGRNEKAAGNIISFAQRPGVKLTFVACETGSNTSVVSAATTILSLTPTRLDVLVCCAGIMAKPPGVSKDDYEIQFATSQLGHSLLVRKLLPLMDNTATDKVPGAEPRIIMVSSIAWWKGTPAGGMNPIRQVAVRAELVHDRILAALRTEQVGQRVVCTGTG